MANDLVLDFTLSGAGAQRCGAGWSLPEPDGTWMVGEHSLIMLPRPDAEGDYLLELELGALLGPGRERQRLAVGVGGTVVAEMVLPPSGVRHCVLPWSAIGDAPELILVLSHPDAWSPADLGGGNDDRRVLSLHLRTLRLTLLLPAVQLPDQAGSADTIAAGTVAQGRPDMAGASGRLGERYSAKREPAGNDTAQGRAMRPIGPMVPPRRVSWWTRLIRG